MPSELDSAAHPSQEIPSRFKILIAKTSLDGHWRGVAVVSQALREAGFEVILGGMLRAEEIARVARDEDVDLIGLNVGGSIDVVDRVLNTLEEEELTDIPVMAGGTIPPRAVRHLQSRGVSVHLPGGSLSSIREAARRLISETEESR